MSWVRTIDHANGSILVAAYRAGEAQRDPRVRVTVHELSLLTIEKVDQLIEVLQQARAAAAGETDR